MENEQPNFTDPKNEVFQIEEYNPEEDLKLQELKKINDTLNLILESQEKSRTFTEEKEIKENEFKNSIIEILTPSEEEEEEVESQESLLLKTLVEQTAPNEHQKELDTALYYGNLSLIIFIMGVIPAYIVYRFIKGVFTLTRHIL